MTGFSDLYMDVIFEDDNEEMQVDFGETTMVPGTGGVEFTTDETLKLENGILSVNTADEVEKDNTLPVTSAAVYTEVGNINALLATI